MLLIEVALLSIKKMLNEINDYNLINNFV